MKNYLLLLFTFFTITVFGQPTGNIEEDTARANRLYEEAMRLLPAITAQKAEYLEAESESLETIEETIVMKKLMAANTLLEQYPVFRTTIKIKGELAFLYSLLGNTEAAIELSEQTINEALSNGIDSLDNCLFKSYCTKAYTNQLIRRSIGEFAERVYQTATDADVDDFIYFKYKYISELIYQNNKFLLDKNLSEFEVFLNKSLNQNFTYGNIYYYWLQMSYNSNIVRNIDKSIAYGNKVVFENEKHQILVDEELGMVYYELGQLYASINNDNEAMKLLEKSLSLSQNPDGRGLIYIEIARIVRGNDLNKNDLKKALEYALKAREEFLVSGNPFFLHGSTGDIALYYHKIGNNILFKQYMEESLEYNRNAGLLITFGKVLKEIGEYEAALNLIQEALIEFVPEFSSMDFTDNPSENDFFKSSKLGGRALMTKGEVFYEQAMESGKTEQRRLLNLSLESTNIAVEVLEKELINLNGFESSKLIYNRNINDALERLLKIRYALWELEKTPQSINMIIEIMERKKAVSILDVLSPPDLPAAILTKEKQLLQDRVNYELKFEFLSDNDSLEFYNNQLLSINDELEILEQEIIKKDPKQRFFYKDKVADLTTLQQALDNNTLFVQYSLAPSNDLFILAISKESHNIKEIEIDDTFFDNINVLNQLLKNPLLIQTTNRDKFIAISNRLYQKLLLPIQDELSNYSNIQFINDYLLHNLPFEVLLKTNDKKDFKDLDFLIKNYDISYQYSATVYTQLKNKPTIKDNSLFAFAPVFNENSAIGSTRNIGFLVDSLYQGVDNGRFLSLPNTKMEVQAIAKTLKGKGQTTVLLERNATKANYNQAIKKQSYQFVHIATHGLVNFQNPKLSALACYSETDDVEQNLLFANEIQVQDIQVDLVVLSSCESGIGQLINGEGLIALNRSFIISGANNVIFSLWKVSDEYSAELMIDFYKFYLETNDYSAALRQAKLKMLQDPTTANPRYWAAFVLIGA
jgi:CHAT domain-containing protein